MGGIELNAEIAAPAQDAWEQLRDFGGLAAWMPGIEKSLGISKASSPAAARL